MTTVLKQFLGREVTPPHLHQLKIKNFLYSFFYFILKYFSPKKCLACGDFGFYLCADCLAEVELIEKQKCPVCEKPSLGGKTHPGCQNKYALDGLFSLFVYKKIIRKAIKNLKYQRITDIKEELSTLVNGAFKFYFDEDNLVELEHFIVYYRPTIVPIPLHWLRRLTRMFNQSEFLAEIFADEYNLPIFTDFLVRNRYTISQTKFKGKKRKKNVAGAFSLKMKIPIEHVLLVDDVTTTGATLSAAANVLKRKGVKKVWALTLAA